MGQDADALRGGKKSVPGMELHAGAMSKYAMGAHTTETTNQKHHARHAAFSHMVGDPTKQFEGMPDNFRYSYGGLIALLRIESAHGADAGSAPSVQNKEANEIMN